MLDFCVKPVFSVMLVVGHWNINPGRMSLRIRDFTDPSTSEKDGADGAIKDGVNGHRNGTTATGADAI